MTFGQGHIAKPVWSIRPRVAAAADRGTPTVLVTDTAGLAALAALALRGAGIADVRMLAGGRAWRRAICAKPALPTFACSPAGWRTGATRDSRSWPRPMNQPIRIASIF